jgi:PAS domain S-box-containing protein
MANPLPDPAPAGGSDETAWALSDALDGLLEFTGAAAGWVAVRAPDGKLTFPACRGPLPERCLAVQGGRDGVWGFAVREGPTLLNDLPGLPPLGEPPLRSLLSCPLGPPDAPLGHVGLANKANGFTSHDAAVLQGVAHLMARRLRRARCGAPAPPPGLAAPLLDRVGDAVLVVDEGGRLVYANAAWFKWTGFSADELLGLPAPFPFWLSHRELAAAVPGAGPAGPLPFRRRDRSVFWCQVEELPAWAGGGRPLAAVLHRADAPGTAAASAAAVLPALALTDRRGRVVWASAALDRLLPEGPGGTGMLRDRFDPPAAAALERVARAASARPGRLLLQHAGRPVAASWVAIELGGGPGLLFALADGPEALAGAEAPAEPAAPPVAPEADWLALLLDPEGEVAFWDARWERLTGLPAADLSGVRGEVALDWLFPRQADRNLVADWLHHPHRRGGQAVLDVLTDDGGRPLLCTTLPVADGPDGRGRWLLLVGPAAEHAGPGSPARAFVRKFTGGLSRLLNHYFAGPVGLAEAALDQPDLPPPVAARFQQILDSCQRASRLVAALEDLAAESAGETQPLSLAGLVREFLDGRAALARPYRLTADLYDGGALVRVNPRMVRVVLGHLLTNAEQALEHAARREVAVRVFVADGAVRCEVEDTGEGPPDGGGAAWLPAPFASTRGAFARDPAHAAQEAAGLGLAVCQHLLALQRGRLELRGSPGGGATAAFVLPRADAAPSAATPARRDLTAGAPYEPAREFPPG